MQTDTTYRAGDTLLLNDGRKVTVDGITTSYHDREGDHEGPFVTVLPGYEHLPYAAVAKVVKRNENDCEICGGGVTSKDPAKYPYCRSCHYTGAVAERLNGGVLDTLRALLGPDAEVGIEHTGGGCMWLAVRYPDSPFYWAATEGEASIPEFDKGELWGLACRYCDDEETAQDVVFPAGTFVKNESKWNEYDGLPIIWTEAVASYADDAKGDISHEALAKAILADRESLRAAGRLS